MAQLIGWLALAVAVVWLGLSFFGVASSPEVLVVLFAIGVHLLLNGIPAIATSWPWRKPAA